VTGARSAAAQRVFPGQSFPLGDTVMEGGVNFCTSSRHASAIELLLFASVCDAEPSRVIRLDAPRPAQRDLADRAPGPVRFGTKFGTNAHVR
jgi:hypothetical protein